MAIILPISSGPDFLVLTETEWAALTTPEQEAIPLAIIIPD